MRKVVQQVVSYRGSSKQHRLSHLEKKKNKKADDEFNCHLSFRAHNVKLFHFLGNRRRSETSEKVHEKDRKRKKKKMDLTVRGRNLEKVIFEELCDNSNDDL